MLIDLRRAAGVASARAGSGRAKIALRGAGQVCGPGRLGNRGADAAWAARWPLKDASTRWCQADLNAGGRSADRERAFFGHGLTAADDLWTKRPMKSFASFWFSSSSLSAASPPAPVRRARRPAPPRRLRWLPSTAPRHHARTPAPRAALSQSGHRHAPRERAAHLVLRVAAGKVRVRTEAGRQAHRRHGLGLGLWTATPQRFSRQRRPSALIKEGG